MLPAGGWGASIMYAPLVANTYTLFFFSQNLNVNEFRENIVSEFNFWKGGGVGLNLLGQLCCCKLLNNILKN